MADNRKAQMKHEKLERKKGIKQAIYLKQKKLKQLTVRILMTSHHFVLIASDLQTLKQTISLSLSVCTVSGPKTKKLIGF